MRYGHKLGKMAPHTCCTGDTWFIDLAEEEMRKTLGTVLYTVNNIDIHSTAYVKILIKHPNERAI